MRLFAASIIREIVYRLLKRARSERLSYLVAAEGDSGRISKAVKQLCHNIDHPLKIDEVARELGMSV